MNIGTHGPEQTFLDEILVAASPQGFVVDLAESLGWNSNEWSIRHDTHDTGVGTYLTVYTGNTSPLSFGVVRGIDLDPLFVTGGRKADMPVPLLIMKEAGLPAPARHVAVTDGERTVLIDTSTECPVFLADTADRFDVVIRPVLARESVLDGSLRELPRKSFIMLARELRAWRVEWQTELAADPGIPQPAARAFLDRLMIVRAMIDSLVLDTESDRKLYEIQTAAVRELLASHRSGPDEWCRYLSTLNAEYGLDTLGLSESIDRLFEVGASGPDLCRNLLQQSRTKFTLPVVLESFNYGDPAEKCLVRMIPEFNDDIEFHLGGRIPDTMADTRISANLDELGYRGVLSLFDTLLKLYSEMNGTSDLRNRPDDRSDNGNGHKNVVTDAPRYIMNNCLEVNVNSEQQHRVVALLLHLHLLHYHSRSRHPFNGFPCISACLTCTSDHVPVPLEH